MNQPITFDPESARGAISLDELLSSPEGPDLHDEEPEHFEYGWRYVPRVDSGGREYHVRVALTREDVLHPEMGDVVLNNHPHEILSIYLFNVFRNWMREKAVVFHDTGIYWDVPGLRNHSPDVSVIPGAPQREEWSSYDVAKEGVRPQLLTEITSPNTWTIDLEDKLQHYALARVPYYLVVDMDHADGYVPARLLYYQWTPDGYHLLQPDERGWHWLETVGLWIGIQDGRVHCFQPDGTSIGSYEEVWAQYQTERAARQAAEKAQRAAERKAARAEKARRAEEKARAAAEIARQAEEIARAAAEQRASDMEQRAAAAEAQRQRLEEQLREMELRLRGDSTS